MASSNLSRSQLWGLLLPLLLGLWSVDQADDSVTPTPAAPVEPAAAAVVEIPVNPLNMLTNEELLQNFQQTLDKLNNRLQVQLRIIAESEFLLAKAAKNSQEISWPISPDIERDAQDLAITEAYQQQLEYSKALVIAVKQQLQYQEKEKLLREQHSKRIAAAQTEVGSLLQDSLQLDSFLLQVELRIHDNTLISTAVPKTLDTVQVKELHQSLLTQQTALLDKIKLFQQTTEVAVKELENTHKKLLEAEAAQQIAQEKYDHIQKRQELEKRYAQQPPSQLRVELAALQEERSWLQSTLEVSMRGFTTKREAQEALAEKLAAMTAPETKEPDADQSLKDLAAYHENRLKTLKTYRQALDAQIKAGETLEGDASVLSEHLFKMRVVAEVLERAELNTPTESAPLVAETRAEALKAFDTEVSSRLSDASAAVKQAEQQLVKLEDIEKKSKESVKQARNTLSDLQKKREVMLETQKWEAELKELKADKVAEKFRGTAESLEKSLKVLEQERAEFAKINTAYEEAALKLAALQDPLARDLHKSKQDELTLLSTQLHQFAGIEPPADKTAASASAPPTTATAPTAATTTPPAASTSAAAATTTVPTAGTTTAPATATATPSATQTTAATPVQSPEAPQPDPNAAIVAYQQLLSSQLQIDEEKTKQKAELLTTLQTLEARVNSYLKALIETQQLTQQQQATAMEVKKRVGRGELKDDTIPTGITAALKHDNIAALNTERTQLLNTQLTTTESIKLFSQKDEEAPVLQGLVAEINTLTGKRLDASQQVHKLAQTFTVEQAALTPIERKIQEQAATRRIRTENTLQEFMLAFFHSPEINSLTEILQAYYLELSELEAKQQNLLEQKERYEKAIHYLQDEKNLLTKLLPLFDQHIDKAGTFYEEESVKVKAQLAPDKAQELLATFAAQAGYEVTAPAPLNEADKPAAVVKASEYLFNLQISIEALEQWVELFKARLLATGIDAEIGKDQDKIAELQAKDAALQRRIAVLIGNPPEAVAKLSKEEQPTNPLAWQRFHSGEIGVLRADRLKLYQHILYLIGVKLLVIFIATFVVFLLLKLFIKRLLSRAQKRLDAGEATAASSISVIHLLHKVLKFLIWSTSFILTLDTMGFNTGAIVAGMGIGGIGIAMASQGVLADIFGGVTVMIMRLYKVGDLISFKENWYVVKEIGIRYTTLEDFSYNHRVSVPNAMISGVEIVNISSHPGFTILTNIRLATTNTADKIREAITLIEEVITANPAARFIWVKHDHFDDYSFVLRLHYDVRKFKERSKVETDINCEIVRRFQASGIKFTPLPGLPSEAFRILAAKT